MSDTEAPDTPTSSRLTRRGRVRKWDRAPQPHDWRFHLGNVGRILIAAGLLMFAFVGYQLYGTGIETEAAQNRLEDEFAAQLALFDPPDLAGTPVDDVDEPVEVTATTDVTETTDIPATTEVTQTDVTATTEVAEPRPEDEPERPETGPVVEVVPVARQNLPEVADGDALARLEIPAIGVDDIVVAGVDKTDLKKGPGHFPDTPLPGQLGNTAIAGHRTTFGQPFRNIDQLAVGDEIRVTTPNGVFVYLMTAQQIVTPDDYEVIATSDPTMATITLVSCHPVFTASERIVVSGELDRTESSAVGAPVINYGRETEPDVSDELPGDDVLAGDTTTDADGSESDDTTIDDDPALGATPAEPTSDLDRLGSAEVDAGIADAFSEGWFGDPAANPQVGIWGVLLAFIAAAAYAISRRFRNDLVGLAIGLTPFVVALYFFFQNVNRLLPPNL